MGSRCYVCPSDNLCVIDPLGMMCYGYGMSLKCGVVRCLVPLLMLLLLWLLSLILLMGYGWYLCVAMPLGVPSMVLPMCSCMGGVGIVCLCVY